MEFQFLITCTKTKGTTFLQTFKVRIQVLWCEKNTASHKKVHILDWKLMAIHDCLHWIHVPMMLSEKECIKAITPVSDPFSSLSLHCSLSLLLCTSKPKPLPKAFFGCKCQCIRKQREGECCFGSPLIYRGHQDHEPSLGFVIRSYLWPFFFLN